jgi:hypothetical protein
MQAKRQVIFLLTGENIYHGINLPLTQFWAGVFFLAVTKIFCGQKGERIYKSVVKGVVKNNYEKIISI